MNTLAVTTVCMIAQKLDEECDNKRNRHLQYVTQWEKEN
jgi:hypothetical protein